MFNFEKLRWPYREDTLFSLLAFVVFIVPLAFSQATNENFETVKLVCWLLFIGVAVLIKVFSSQIREKTARFNKPVLFISAGLVVWAFLAAFLAPDKLYAFFGFYYRFTNSFFFLLLWVMTFLLLIDLLDKDKWIFLLKILCFDALLIGAKGIAESMGYTLYQGLEQTSFFRSPSFLGNPDFSAMFMACVLPFVLLFCAQAKKLSAKVFYALSAFIILFCLAIFASRGALLAVGTGAIVFLFLILLNTRGKFFLKALFAVITLTVLSFVIIRISRPDILQFRQTGQNVSFRLAVWKQAGTAILHRPLFGIGLGNFALYHEQVERPQDMDVFDDPHNLWIFLGSTGGLPLLLLFLSLIFVVAWKAFREFLKTSHPLLGASLCALSIFFVSASFTPVAIPCFLVLAVILAGMVALVNPEFYKYSLRRGIKILMGLVGVFFLVWALALGTGECTLHFGYKAYILGNYSRALKLFNLSKSVNPTNKLAEIFAIQSQIHIAGNHEGVVKQIENFKSRHPLQANTYVLAANAYANLYAAYKDNVYLDEAILNLSRSLEIDRQFSERFGELGFYYYLRGDNTKALAYVQYSLLLKPDLLNSFIVEAKIYQQEKDLAKVKEALQNAYKLDPTNFRVKFLWYAAKKAKDVNEVPLNVIYSER